VGAGHGGTTGEGRRRQGEAGGGRGRQEEAGGGRRKNKKEEVARQGRSRKTRKKSQDKEE